MHYLVLFILLAFLSGCGNGSNQPEPEEAKEIPLSENESVTGTEDVLFSDAKKYFANGYYVLAKDTFRSIADTFPLGPYGEFSEIKLADAHFLQKDYGDAAVTYERVMKNRPASRNAAYLLMKAGRSYQLTNTDPMRDREPLEKAITFYNQFIEKYPNSIFRQQVDKYLYEAQKAVVDNERLVADFYKKLGHDAASHKRQEAYQLALARFGLGRNGEKARNKTQTQVAQLTSGSQEKTPVAQPILSDFSSLPDSAPVLVAAARRDVPPYSREKLSSGNTLPTNAGERRGAADGIAPQSSSVRDISCTAKGGKRVTIELLSNLREETPSVVLTPTLGTSKPSSQPSQELRYQLPIELEEPFQLSCFDGKDLFITAEGELTLKTSRPYTVLTVQNPPRIILAEVR